MRVGRTQGLGAGGRGAYLADGGMKSHTWTPACVDASTARTMPCHLLVPGRRHEALTKAHAAECTSRPSQSCLSSAQGSSPAGYEAGRTRQDRTGHDRQAGTELRRVSPTGTALRAASSPVSCFFFFFARRARWIPRPAQPWGPPPMEPCSKAPPLPLGPLGSPCWCRAALLSVGYRCSCCWCRRRRGTSAAGRGPLHCSRARSTNSARTVLLVRVTHASCGWAPPSLPTHRRPFVRPSFQRPGGLHRAVQSARGRRPFLSLPTHSCCLSRLLSVARGQQVARGSSPTASPAPQGPPLPHPRPPVVALRPPRPATEPLSSGLAGWQLRDRDDHQQPTLPAHPPAGRPRQLR